MNKFNKSITPYIFTLASAFVSLHANAGKNELQIPASHEGDDEAAAKEYNASQKRRPIKQNKFQSKKVEFTLRPGIMDAAEYEVKIDGKHVELRDDVITKKLAKLAEEVRKYAEKKPEKRNCPEFSLTPISASGFTFQSTQGSFDGTIHKVTAAQLDDAKKIAKDIRLPNDWKDLCRVVKADH